MGKPGRRRGCKLAACRAQLEARKKAEQQKEGLRKEEEALAQAKLQREKEARAQECRLGVPDLPVPICIYCNINVISKDRFFERLLKESINPSFCKV